MNKIFSNRYFIALAAAVVALTAGTSCNDEWTEEQYVQ